MIALEHVGDWFRVTLPDESIKARRVVVAVGGQSYPGCGTAGDGYTLARRFGHRIIEPKPALVPIRFGVDWVADLKGLTIPDAVAAVVDASGARRLERREAVLFAHFGLTGPAILDVSRAVARGEGEPLFLALDFLPDRKIEAVDQALQHAAPRGSTHGCRTVAGRDSATTCRSTRARFGRADRPRRPGIIA